MFSLQRIGLPELCAAAGVWDSTGGDGPRCDSVAGVTGGWRGLRWSGQGEHSALLPAVERVRCRWENYRRVVRFQRERREEVNGTPRGPLFLPEHSRQRRLLVLFTLPPSGLLEGLSLSCLPKSSVLTLDSLGSLSAQGGSFEHIAYLGGSLGLHGHGAQRAGEQKPCVCLDRGSTNRGACIFFSSTQ